MKKTLTLFAGACFLAGTCLITGCGEEASVTEKTIEKTPEGSKVTTETKKVETSGDTPPPVTAPK